VRYRVEATGTPPIEITVDPAAGGITLHCGETSHTLEAGDASGAIVPVLFDGVRRYVGFARMHDGRYQIVLDGRSWVVAVTDPQAAGVDDAHAGSGSINAPIPGMVVEVHVAEGDTVAAGDPLVTLYAMKLENEIRAPFAGSVAELGAAKGTAVEKGELLVRLESE
jgi:biotin carboxyl carrier protein